MAHSGERAGEVPDGPYHSDQTDSRTEHDVGPRQEGADYTLAVNLTFAARDQRPAQVWWQACDDAGLASVRTTSANQEPHVTLAVLEGPEPEKLVDRLERELAGMGGPTILLAYFGVFVHPGFVLFLGVTPTDELRFLQREVIDTGSSAGFVVWDHYRPGAWVPHCTLARGFSALTDVRPLLDAHLSELPELPILVHTLAVQIVQLPDGNEVGRVPLL
jgi:2'-5' RNA ligase